MRMRRLNLNLNKTINGAYGRKGERKVRNEDAFFPSVRGREAKTCGEGRHVCQSEKEN